MSDPIEASIENVYTLTRQIHQELLGARECTLDKDLNEEIADCKSTREILEEILHGVSQLKTIREVQKGKASEECIESGRTPSSFGPQPIVVKPDGMIISILSPLRRRTLKEEISYFDKCKISQTDLKDGPDLRKKSLNDIFEGNVAKEVIAMISNYTSHCLASYFEASDIRKRDESFCFWNDVPAGTRDTFRAFVPEQEGSSATPNFVFYWLLQNTDILLYVQFFISPRNSEGYLKAAFTPLVSLEQIQSYMYAKRGKISASIREDMKFKRIIQSQGRIKFILRTGYILAKLTMSFACTSLLDVEILETPIPIRQLNFKSGEDNSDVRFMLANQNSTWRDEHASKLPADFGIDLTNALAVPLFNGMFPFGNLYANSIDLPGSVDVLSRRWFPFHLAVDNMAAKNLSTTLCYDIFSTDLKLVIAVSPTVKGNFALAFMDKNSKISPAIVQDLFHEDLTGTFRMDKKVIHVMEDEAKNGEFVTIEARDIRVSACLEKTNNILTLKLIAFSC